MVLEEARDGDEQMSVTADNRAGARMLADHLIRTGHTRIAFIAARQPRPMVDQRHVGNCEALAAAGMRPPDAVILDLLLPDCSGIEVCRELRTWSDAPIVLVSAVWDAADAGAMVDRLLALPHPPTAVMGGNDLLAIGVMRRARARGLRVPEDLAVTGFNDFAFAEFVEPPLTTVHVPGYEMGCSAAQLLIEHLDGQEISEPHIMLPVELRLRGSA